ncbi:hypothetical protein KY359_06015 [Candidatus Woesearchaeota archaeon]|nr:hypothetical protein [Candidatus Woesearchaeota archaeon]
MVIIEMPKDEKTEAILDSMVEHLKELKDETSQIRRLGSDTSMVELMMIDLLPKVRLARTTYDQRDIDEVKRSLAQIRHEIDLVKEGTEFDAALKKIQDAYDDIRSGNIKDAVALYQDLRNVYAKLPEDQRRIVFKASLDIHRRIVENTGNAG